MPNARKDGKTNSSVWLTKTEKAMLKSVREALGLKTDSDVIKEAISRIAKEKGIQQ